MSSVVLVGLALVLALLGHTSFWVGLVNRMHGRAWPEVVLRSLTLGCVVVWGVLAVGLLGQLAAPNRYAGLGDFVWESGFGQLAWPWQGYLVMCWVVAGHTLWAWLWRRLLHRPPKVLLHQEVKALAVPIATQDRAAHHPMVWLPQNEILRIELTRREIRLARLPAPLDGIRILHLSDLHFTGRVAQEWFRQAMDFCARLQPDLVALTGDFLDTMECLDWIPKVLAPLKARWGVYFILGNHDWRLDWPRIREEIARLGFVWVGGRWIVAPGANPPEVKSPLSSLCCPPSCGSIIPQGNSALGSLREVSSPTWEGRILLAGNELPWIGPAPELHGAPPPASQGGPIRILLAHSPDQIQWARKHQFDLMLAGHTHGGQIRIPLIGPFLTPSRSGVRYAGSLFHEPPTVLHVTRGISAEWPLRWNCPPEMVLLVLRSPGHSAPTS